MVSLLRAVVAPASASSLSGPIGGYRRYAVGRARLSDVVGVARYFEASVNDVMLAAVSGGYRMLLLQRGERPDPHAIRSLVPVSVRAPDDAGVHHNRISLMLPFLPVDVADPVWRLKAVRAQMSRLKASGEAEAGAAMTALVAHEPFLPVAWSIRLAARLPQRSIVTVTTNVPGPRQPLYMLGRQILEVLPYVPIAVRLRTGVAVITYCDRVSIGVTADYGSAPEADLLAAAIEAGIAELVAAGPGPEPARAATPRPPRPSRRPRRKKPES